MRGKAKKEDKKPRGKRELIQEASTAKNSSGSGNVRSCGGPDFWRNRLRRGVGAGREAF